MSFDPTPYAGGAAFLYWLVVFGCALGIAAGVAFLTALAVRGLSGPVVFGQEVAAGVSDALFMSPRRVWALTMLTIREASRRKILYVLAVFAVLFMFAGWFLSDTNQAPDLQVKVYVSFVLRAISWLILPIAILLACWGIPEDIKARSLHTVVTKPVRRSEIVVGRMLGYVLVGTVVLAIMGVVGYIWIQRQVSSPEARAQLTARVPIYGSLTFLGREGEPAKAGVNVGDIWEFRSYIEGATKSRAIWTFAGISDESINDNNALRLESRFQAFRTHKGNIGRSLYYQYIFVNPEKNLTVTMEPYLVNEFREDVREIPRTLRAPEATIRVEGADAAKAPREVDLVNDLVDQNGNLVIQVRAVDPGQYIGMARPDLFVRTPDRSFAAAYFKAVLGIWLMMTLIIILGVTASTFLKGPVATLLTFCLIVVGQGFREFMEKMVEGQTQGGGLFESIYRIVTHMNPQTPLPANPASTAMQWVDWVLLNFLWLVRQLIPNFDYFGMAPYVANGFDVPWSAALLPSVMITAAYLLPCFLLGYYSLRLRELEAK